MELYFLVMSRILWLSRSTIVTSHAKCRIECVCSVTDFVDFFPLFMSSLLSTDVPTMTLTTLSALIFISFILSSTTYSVPFVYLLLFPFYIILYVSSGVFCLSSRSHFHSFNMSTVLFFVLLRCKRSRSIWLTAICVRRTCIWVSVHRILYMYVFTEKRLHQMKKA